MGTNGENNRTPGRFSNPGAERAFDKYQEWGTEK